MIETGWSVPNMNRLLETRSLFVYSYVHPGKIEVSNRTLRNKFMGDKTRIVEIKNLSPKNQLKIIPRVCFLKQLSVQDVLEYCKPEVQLLYL